MTTKQKLEKKLAIMNGTALSPMSDVTKNRDVRKKFWSDMMDLAEKDGDKLKASELLGKTEADFVERTRLEGDPDKPLEWIITVVDPSDKIANA